MVDEKDVEATKQKSSQIDALQNQFVNVLTGVEKSLAVTCETIIDTMKELENKIQDMEKRYSELAKDAEQALLEAGKCDQPDEKKQDGDGEKK